MQQLAPLLARAGLSKRETTVFLHLLQLGVSTATIIANKAGVTRTHVYDIIPGLVERGLVTEYAERGVKQYAAVGYDGVLAFLSRKQKELDQLKADLQQSASLFNKLQTNNKQRTEVKFFNGPLAFRNVYEAIRKDMSTQPASSEIVTFWPVEQLEHAYPGFLENNIFITFPGLKKRDIMTDCPLTYKIADAYKKSGANHSFKIWPEERGAFPVDAICWLNKISLTDTTDPPSSTIIENAAIATSFRLWFDLMWDSL